MDEDAAASDDDDEEESGGDAGDGMATTATPDIQEEDTPSTPKKVSNPNGDVVITIPHRHSDWFFQGSCLFSFLAPSQRIWRQSNQWTSS